MLINYRKSYFKNSYSYSQYYFTTYLNKKIQLFSVLFLFFYFFKNLRRTWIQDPEFESRIQIWILILIHQMKKSDPDPGSKTFLVIIDFYFFVVMCLLNISSKRPLIIYYRQATGCYTVYCMYLPLNFMSIRYKCKPFILFQTI